MKTEAEVIADWEWRFMRAGRVRHAVAQVGAPTLGRAGAACGAGPWSSSDWRGTGSQAEYEYCASLPCCRRCLRKITPIAVRTR